MCGCFHIPIVAPTIRLLSVNEDEDEDEREDGRNELTEDSFTEDEEESSIMDEDDTIDDDNVNKKLKELVEIVHICLEANPGMQSTSLINASKDLLKTYKSEFVGEALANGPGLVHYSLFIMFSLR